MVTFLNPHTLANAVALQCGPNVISLGVTTVDGRFKKVKDDILAMSKSFRANIVKAEFEKAGSSVRPKP